MVSPFYFLSGQMMQAFDNMIRDFHGLLTNAMNGFSKRVAHSKLRAFVAFVRMWKEYSKICQMSDFVTETLENENSLQLMRQYFKSVDIESIADRAAMILESTVIGYTEILQVMTSFERTLDDDQSLDIWCDWTNETIRSVVPTENVSIEDAKVLTADMHCCWLSVR